MALQDPEALQHVAVLVVAVVAFLTVLVVAGRSAARALFLPVAAVLWWDIGDDGPALVAAWRDDEDRFFRVVHPLEFIPLTPRRQPPILPSMNDQKYTTPGANREKVRVLHAAGAGPTEIARKLNISRSRVYQLLAALAKAEQKGQP